MIPFYNRTSANHNLSWQPAVWLLSLLSALFVYVWLAPFTHPFEPLSDYFRYTL
jgi:hypothetical protein